MTERGLLLGRLGSVLRPGLLPILHPAGIQGSTDNVVTNAGQVLDFPTAYQHDRVLLQIMPLTRDVRRDFHLIGKAHPGDLPKRGIRLFWRHRLHLGANAPLLRCTASPALTTSVPTDGCKRVSERRRLGLLMNAFSAFTDQLIDRWHDKLLIGQMAFVTVLCVPHSPAAADPFALLVGSQNQQCLLISETRSNVRPTGGHKG